MSKFDMRDLLAENKRLKKRVEELEKRLEERDEYSEVLDKVFEMGLERETRELEDV